MSTDRFLMYTDTEVDRIEQDRLGRAPFARRVARRIAYAGDGRSVVFGLSGRWGSGKTSVVNMICEVLDEEHGNHWSVVKFVPWSAADVETLTDEFYASIASAMPGTDEGKRAAIKLLTMAAPVVAAAGKVAVRSAVERYLGDGTAADLSDAVASVIADKSAAFKVKPDPFLSRFDDVSSAIKSVNRNVLVIVDDIDRLHPEELLTVMKAVRLLGRFDRVHYLLSYDEDTLLGVLRASSIARGDSDRAQAYLEKIIQYPFLLPPLQPSQIRAELHHELDSVAKIHDVPPMCRGEDAVMHSTIDAVIEALSDSMRKSLTIRSIRRLASQIDVMLSLLDAREVDFVDAALITYLRLHHRELYDQLPNWYEDLIGGLRTMRVDYAPVSTEQWEQRIASTCRIEAGSSLVKDLVALLDKLFPQVSQRQATRYGSPTRIRSSQYFGRYFAFGIPVDDIADNTVREELEHLATYGQLRACSPLIGDRADKVRRSLIYGKAIANLDVIDICPATGAAQGAWCLTRLQYDQQPVEHWHSVIYALLRRAVAVAATPETATQCIDAYAAEFGLLETSVVLLDAESPVHSNKLNTPERKAVVAASRNVRNRILQECQDDLISTDGDSVALTMLQFARNIDTRLHQELRKFAAAAIESSRVATYELAARFIGPADNASSPYKFHAELFDRLVPVKDWNFNTIPEADQSQTCTGDGTLRDRIRYAPSAMRRWIAEH
ncbi:KAP family P-loop NTPase fold protein [Mycobacteroides abscessus]|uniref:KAP family P-loop NTPase fold protein n=1 Tax=Mycobacteroides abscessus TaxID=36809 RepID=UPI0013F6246F|nr:KAP family NTPase [Mycobacteroides abscessus]